MKKITNEELAEMLASVENNGSSAVDDIVVAIDNKHTHDDIVAVMKDADVWSHDGIARHGDDIDNVYMMLAIHLMS